MTRPSTLPAAPAHGRRTVGRAVAGGLAALAVAPALAEAAGAAEAAKPKPKPKRKWHRCKVHKKHTCWHARTCPHRKHKPASPARPAEPTRVRRPRPVRTTSRPPCRRSSRARAALHLASRFTYGMTPALHAGDERPPTRQAWFEAQLQPATIATRSADALQSWWPSLDLDAPTLWQREQDEVEGSLGGDGQLPALVPDAPDLAPSARCSRSSPSSSRTTCTCRSTTTASSASASTTGSSSARTPSAGSTRCSSRRSPTPRWGPASTTPARRSPPPTRTSAASCSSCTPSAAATTPRTTSRTPRGSSPATGSTCGDLERPGTTRRATGPAPVKVLGFSHANAAADGRPVAEAYLTYLAHHPATAQRLAKKLAVRFVSDSPSDGARPAPRRRLPGEPDRDRPGPPGPGRPPGVRGRRRRQGAHARPTTSWPPTAPWTSP